MKAEKPVQLQLVIQVLQMRSECHVNLELTESAYMDNPEIMRKAVTALQKEGFTVIPYIHGMGENEAVRNIFVERALESWEALQQEEEGQTSGMPH